jgi:hypothetical protein
MLQKWDIPVDRLSGFPESVDDKSARFQDSKNFEQA